MSAPVLADLPSEEIVRRMKLHPEFDEQVKRLRVGELCAGYNGLGMAVEAAFGAEPAWFSEFDDAPSKILAHHYPDVPNYGDMTQIDWAAIEQVDVLSGGTPCQDLSHAGRRAGMTDGTRSNLWVQMREAIAIQRPRYVVWENVRGAYSAGADSAVEHCPGCVGDAGNGKHLLRALGRVLGDLSDLGYDIQWRGLRASDVGAPHSRFRVFVLARRRGLDGHADSSYVEGVGSGRFEVTRMADEPRERGSSGADAANPDGRTGWRSADAGDPSGGQAEVQESAHADGLRCERPRDARGRWTRSANGSEPSADTSGDQRRICDGNYVLPRGVPDGQQSSTGGSAASDASYAAGDGERPCAEPQQGGEDASDALGGGRVGRTREARGKAQRRATSERSSEGVGEAIADARGAALGEQAGGTPKEEAWAGSRDGLGHHHGEQSPTNWGPYEPAIRRWEQTIGRDAPRPTEPTGRNGGERLSPRFTEWMMGLPDGWVTSPDIGISRNEQLKACGNGVVPQQAMAALRHMIAAFDQQDLGVAA